MVPEKVKIYLKKDDNANSYTSFNFCPVTRGKVWLPQIFYKPAFIAGVTIISSSWTMMYRSSTVWTEPFLTVICTILLIISVRILAKFYKWFPYTVFITSCWESLQFFVINFMMPYCKTYFHWNLRKELIQKIIISLEFNFSIQQLY